MLSPYTFLGRRRGGRRSSESTATYVDRLRPGTIWIALTIVTLSGLDALLTLLQLENGAVEANPVMDLALSQGVGAFLVCKGVLTVIGVLVLAIHQNFSASVKSQWAILTAYCCLTLYHFCLLAPFVVAG